MLDYLEEDKDITQYSSFKTKAKTRYFYSLDNIGDILKISELYNFSKDNNLKFLILGGGTNCLFAFREFDGIIIKNNLKGWKLDKDRIKIMSAEDISPICEKLLYRDKIESLYPWIGLPGTLGGAVYGNAGCFGLRMQDVFLEATILDIYEGRTFIVDKEFLDFSYRSSILKASKRYFLTDATLYIKHETNTNKIEDIIDFRQNRQPKGNSCGSFFVNPEGQSAGRLLEEAQMKGKRVNKAFVSELHANFIINEGDDYEDIITLKEICKKEVRDKFSIELKEEVNIIT